MEIKPALAVTKPTAHLKSMQLDNYEMAVVSREAFCHATMRLGEMLHDIQEDMGMMGDRANWSQRSDHVGEVKQIMSRMLGLLGRIHRNDSNMNRQ